MSDNQVPPEKVWIDMNDLLRSLFHPTIAQGVAASTSPDTLKPSIAYHRCTCTPEAAPAETARNAAWEVVEWLQKEKILAPYPRPGFVAEISAIIERHLPTTSDAAIPQENQKGKLT